MNISPYVYPGLLALYIPTHGIYNNIGELLFKGTEDEVIDEFNRYYHTQSAIPGIPDFYISVYNTKEHIIKSIL